jgi:ferredoxin
MAGSVSLANLFYLLKGIDVRSYAQKENIVRSSCGCGVCSAVCPRGVLKLEMTRLQAESILMRFY